MIPELQRSMPKLCDSLSAANMTPQVQAPISASNKKAKTAHQILSNKTIDNEGFETSRKFAKVLSQEVIQTPTSKSFKPLDSMDTSAPTPATNSENISTNATNTTAASESGKAAASA